MARIGTFRVPRNATSALAEEMLPRQVAALSHLAVAQLGCGHSHCVAVTESGDAARAWRFQQLFLRRRLWLPSYLLALGCRLCVLLLCVWGGRVLGKGRHAGLLGREAVRGTLGITSPFFPGILLSRKPPKSLGNGSGF